MWHYELSSEAALHTTYYGHVACRVSRHFSTGRIPRPQKSHSRDETDRHLYLSNLGGQCRWLGTKLCHKRPEIHYFAGRWHTPWAYTISSYILPWKRRPYFATNMHNIYMAISRRKGYWDVKFQPWIINSYQQNYEFWVWGFGDLLYSLVSPSEPKYD